MAAQRNQSLVLDISANIGGLATQTKAARSALLEFQSGAVGVAAAVDKAFSDLGASGPAAAAKQADREFDKLFRSVRANAEAIKGETDQAFALRLFDVGAADEQVRALTQQAAQLRVTAAGFETASREGGEFAARQGEIAIALQSNAVQLEQKALAIDHTAAAFRAATQAQREFVAAQAAPAVRVDSRSGLERLLAGQASLDRAAVAGRTLEQVLARVSGKTEEVTQAVNRQATATERATGLDGQRRAALNQLSFQLNDVAQGFALGVSPATIFAQQIGQVTQAVQGLGGPSGSGKLGALVSFLGSGWGLAIGTAVAVLGPFVAKLFETEETLEKVKTAAEDAADSVKSLTDSIGRSSPVSDAATKNIRALLEAQGSLARIKREIAAIEGSGDKSQGFRLIQLQREKKAAEEQIAAARAGIEEVRSASRAIELQRAATERARAADEAATKALRERTKATKDLRETVEFGSPVAGGSTSGRFGESRPGHAHGGVDIAVEVGTAVRAVADGIVKFAGERGNYGNVVYVDAGGPEIRDAHLSRIAVEVGDRVRKGDIIGYSGGARGAAGAGNSGGPHLHHEVRVGGKPVNPFGRFAVDPGKIEDRDARLADREQDEAARAAEQAARRQAAFDDATADADRRILDAKLGLVTDAGERAAFAKVQLQLDAEAYSAALEEKVRRGDLTEAQAFELTVKNGIARQLVEQKLDLEERQRQLDEATALERDEIDGKVALLRLQGDLATTAEQRRTVARQILELELTERRRAAQRLLQSNDPGQRAQGQRDLDQLDREAPLLRAGNERDNADPVQRYLDELERSAGDTTEALLEVRARGLKSLEDGLAGVITGSESVGSAFRKLADGIIADLVRIGVQKAILGTFGGGGILGGILGGGIGGGAGALGGRGPADSLGTIATAPLGFAGGGRIVGPGTATSDSILARVSNGEFIFNAAAVQRVGLPTLEALNAGRLPAFAAGGRVGTAPAFRAPDLGGPPGNDNTAGGTRVFDLRGAVVTADLLQQMEALASSKADTAVIRNNAREVRRGQRRLAAAR